MKTIDEAIARLEVLRSAAPAGGKTRIGFSDGSPIIMTLSKDIEMSPDLHGEEFVQVRIDREAIDSTKAAALAHRFGYD